jgi:sugar (pentulose or hexulose) kinase
MSDVHHCPVIRSAVPKSTALGAALIAAYGYFASIEKPHDWKELVKGFTDPMPSSRINPDPAASALYNRLIESYERLEREWQN